MQIRLAIAFFCFSISLIAAREEPKRPADQPGDGWIDLMKPDVWKKYDPKWIVN